MARLILSAGMLTPLASWIALRSRGLPSASPPPIRAAMVISLMTFVNMRPRFASRAPFLCLILAHLEWPDISTPYRCAKFRFSLAQTGGRLIRGGKMGYDPIFPTSFLLEAASGEDREPALCCCRL